MQLSNSSFSVYNFVLQFSVYFVVVQDTQNVEKITANI